MVSSFRLKARFQFTTMCYCAAVFLTFGFIAVIVAGNMSNALNNDMNLYLTVWGGSIVMIVLSLVMIGAAFLVSSSKVSRLELGGFIGVMGSIIGLFIAVDLASAIFGVQAQRFTTIGLTFENILMVCFVAVLLVGFPLGMIGSLGGIRNSEAVLDSAASDNAPTG